MDPKPEQVAAFGRQARQRREQLGLSADEVAARVTRILGREVKRQSITQWENGQGTPRQQDKLDAYDQALEAGGELAAMLVPRMDERIAELERRADVTEALLDQILARLEGR